MSSKRSKARRRRARSDSLRATYAVIETASESVRSSATKPRGHGYETGSPDESLFAGNEPFPRTGSGFTASKNGKLIPEHSIDDPVTMAAGLTNGSPTTTMKFRFADGSPFPQTVVRADGTTAGPASDWMLAVDPTNPVLKIWVPLP